jgi:hypothetical protein
LNRLKTRATPLSTVARAALAAVSLAMSFGTFSVQAQSPAAPSAPDARSTAAPFASVAPFASDSQPDSAGLASPEGPNKLPLDNSSPFRTLLLMLGGITACALATIGLTSALFALRKDIKNQRRGRQRRFASYRPKKPDSTEQP